MNKFPLWKSLITLTAAAGFSAMAFPPVGGSVLTWVSLIPFLLIMDNASLPGAFGRGYWFGLWYFLGTLWWIGHVTVGGLLLLVAYLALYWGLFATACRVAAGLSFGGKALVLPAIYVVLEYVRDHFLTGFGWANLGHSQAGFSPLLYVCAWTGVAGLSFLVVMVNLTFKEWLLALPPFAKGPGSRKWPVWPAVLVLAIISAGIAVPSFQRDTAGGSPRPQTTVALIQPNVSLGEMWTASAKARVVDKLLDKSRQTLPEKPDLIIWPESSFPHFYWDLPELWNKVLDFARENRVSILVGAVTEKDSRYYNSALLISPLGQLVGTYSKRHLVLFGEYIPFRKELPFLASIVPIDDFTPGEDAPVFELPNGARFSVLVCFEDTLAGLGRQDTLQGADFLVNMTNDAWFRDSGQPRMHLLNALLRSAENNRPLVRATNTGESCVIASNGQVDKCVEDASSRRVLIDGVLVRKIRGESRRTFYTKYGDVFTLLCALGILVAVLCRFFFPGRRRVDAEY